jgi:hypothetical protein
VTQTVTSSLETYFVPLGFTLVSCLAYSWTLKTEATCSSETLVDFQRTTRRCIPEDRTLQNVRRYYFQHISGIHTPVGNSDMLTEDFSSVRLPTRDMTWSRRAPCDSSSYGGVTLWSLAVCYGKLVGSNRHLPERAASMFRTSTTSYRKILVLSCIWVTIDGVWFGNWFY